MFYIFKVGTGTGIMTHYFNLFVIVPTAMISGKDEYHIGEGSSITLFCNIENVSIIIIIFTYYVNTLVFIYDQRITFYNARTDVTFEF